jgi:hypothetical protein
MPIENTSVTLEEVARLLERPGSAGTDQLLHEAADAGAERCLAAIGAAGFGGRLTGTSHGSSANLTG